MVSGTLRARVLPEVSTFAPARRRSAVCNRSSSRIGSRPPGSVGIPARTPLTIERQKNRQMSGMRLKKVWTHKSEYSSRTCGFYCPLFCRKSPQPRTRRLQWSGNFFGGQHLAFSHSCFESGPPESLDLEGHNCFLHTDKINSLRALWKRFSERATS